MCGVSGLQNWEIPDKRHRLVSWNPGAWLGEKREQTNTSYLAQESSRLLARLFSGLERAKFFVAGRSRRNTDGKKKKGERV